MNLTIDELLSYTDEEREKWHRWFTAHGNEPLKIALAGKTHPNLGALILHCYWAEIWYASLLRGEVLTAESEFVRENKDLPNDQVESVFGFGVTSRKALREFTDRARDEDWGKICEAEAGEIELRGSPRKLVAHLLLHEIRHWAQIAIMVRERGLEPPGDHDLIFSKSFGEVMKRRA